MPSLVNLWTSPAQGGYKVEGLGIYSVYTCVSLAESAHGHCWPSLRGQAHVMTEFGQVKDWRMWISIRYKMLIFKMNEDWWLAQSHSSVMVGWTLIPEVRFLGTAPGSFPDRRAFGVLDSDLFIVQVFLATVASLTSVPHPLNGSSIPLSYDNQKGSYTSAMASRGQYLPWLTTSVIGPIKHWIGG